MLLCILPLDERLMSRLRSLLLSTPCWQCTSPCKLVRSGLQSPSVKCHTSSPHAIDVPSDMAHQLEASSLLPSLLAGQWQAALRWNATPIRATQKYPSPHPMSQSPR